MLWDEGSRAWLCKTVWYGGLEEEEGCALWCVGGGERACAYEVASFVHSGFWLDGLGLC